MFFFINMKDNKQSNRKRNKASVSRWLKKSTGILLACGAGYCLYFFVFPIQCSPSNGDLARAIATGDPVRVNSVVMSSRESFSRSYRVNGKSLRQLAEETCNKQIVDMVDYALDKELVDILLGK